MGKDNFKGEILVGHYSRGVASSGDSFSYKFQGRDFHWEGGHWRVDVSRYLSVSAEVPRSKLRIRLSLA